MKLKGTKHKEPERTITNAFGLPWTLEEIRSFPCYGGFLNSWRQRFVNIYQPPVEFLQENPGKVITVGSNYRTNTFTICLEDYSAYKGRIENADWSEYK